MSKIQLKNVSKMNQGIPAGPLDGTLNMREAGALNESGMLDDSGLIDDSGLWLLGAEYGYANAEVGPFTLRYLVMWKIEDISGEASIRFYARLDDDDAKQYTSGDFGDPVSNSDPEHYDYSQQTLDSYCLSNGRFIEGNCTVYYNYYPYGKYGSNVSSSSYGSFSFAIPGLDEGI